MVDLLGVDRDLYEIMQEIYGAIDGDLNIMAGTGMRTAFDRATEVLGIDASKRFFEKIDALKTDGHIGGKETDDINTIVEAGSAAAHRGWKPKSDEIATLMTTLEAFIYRTMIGPEKLEKVRKRVPDKPPHAKKQQQSGP